MSVSSDVGAETNLLGKVVADLQSGVTVSGSEITGTLLYVTGYTGFSGDATEQSGNYLALKCTAQSGDTITVDLVGGSHPGAVTLDDDGIVVLRITNKNTQKVRYVATAADGTTETREFGLSGLTLNAE